MLDSNSLFSYSTEETCDNSFSLENANKKFEDTESIRKFSVLLKKINKLESTMESLFSKTTIDNKMNKILNKMSNLCNADHNIYILKKIEEMKIISNLLKTHKKYLIDFSLKELKEIINKFSIIKKLDNSRLLYLQRKIKRCSKIILQTIIEK